VDEKVAAVISRRPTSSASSSSRAEVFVAECPRDRAASSAGLQARLVFVGAFERVAWIGGEASAGRGGVQHPGWERERGLFRSMDIQKSRDSEKAGASPEGP